MNLSYFFQANVQIIVIVQSHRAWGFTHPNWITSALNIKLRPRPWTQVLYYWLSGFGVGPKEHTEWNKTMFYFQQSYRNSGSLCIMKRRQAGFPGNNNSLEVRYGQDQKTIVQYREECGNRRHKHLCSGKESWLIGVAIQAAVWERRFTRTLCVCRLFPYSSPYWTPRWDRDEEEGESQSRPVAVTTSSWISVCTRVFVLLLSSTCFEQDL